MIPGAVSLRRFPFPYRAGLSLCSDIDCCDRTAFVRLHRLLNRDLGLAVADSFFGWSPGEDQLAYFTGRPAVPSADAPFIRRALQDGLIDALHSWGDFNGRPPEPDFLLPLAERLTAELAQAGLGPRIWLNHGDRRNWQNLGHRGRPEWRGDDPRSPLYTGDLLARLGIEFYWSGDLVSWPLGPGSPGLGLGLVLAGNRLKNAVKLVLGRGGDRRSAQDLTDLANPATLRDGRRLWRFSRFKAVSEDKIPATRLALRDELSPANLDRLVAQEGFAVVYTHFGRPVLAGERLFEPADRQALEHLAGLQAQGRIWVAATADLLSYWLALTTLRWEVAQEGENLIIDLRLLDDPVTGPRVPEPSALAGLTFYAPNPDKAYIRLGRDFLPAKVNPPDHTGRASLGLSLPAGPRLDLLEG